MAQLPADRTKLAQAQSNMAPSFTASSQKLKDALTEAYDTIDLLNQKVNDHGAAPTLPHPDKSVTRAKLADKVVGAGQLDDAAVGQSHHQDNGIPSRALPDNVILQRHMSDNSVGSAEIQAGAVQAQHIAGGAIGPSQLQTGLTAAVDVNAQFAKRGIDVTSAPYNVDPTGIVDSTAAIQSALNNNQSVFLPPGNTFLINSTLTVPDGVSLFSIGTGATIKTNTINISCVSLGQESKLGKFTFQLPPGNTLDSACAIRLRTSATSTRAYVKDILIKGSDSTANGIYASDTANYIAFSVFQNIYADKVKNVVMFNMTSPSYCNGNVFDNIVIRSSVRGFYLVGAEGNKFSNIQWNTGPASVEVIYCASNFNKFEGWFWDLNSGAVPNMLATFSGTASGNMIESPDTVSNWIINDTTNTKLNFINAHKDDIYEIIKMGSYLPNVWMSTVESQRWGYWYRFKPYGGVQDNILAFADKLNTVTNTGKALSSGTLAPAFDPFSGISAGKPNWNLTGAEQAQITIDIVKPGFATKRLDFLQVVFSTTLEARYVKLEYSTDAGATWATVLEVADNNKRFVVWHGDNAASATNNPNKLRITISDPINASKDVRVEAIIGRMLASPGFTFMPLNGAMPMVGNLDMNKNKLVNSVLDQAVTASRPAAPVMGQMFYDTTLKKPIWHNGTAWTDAAGTVV